MKRIFRRRRRFAVLGWIALAAVAPSQAAAGVQLRGVAVGSYPTVRATVVTSPPVAKPPKVLEDGHPVVGFNAVNLGREKSVVLALDRSRSMTGAAFTDAVRAARTFVGMKGASDRISVVAFGRRAVTLSGFSSAALDASNALDGLTVDRRTGTALYDGVLQASRQLATEPHPGRVILLLTDGADAGSSSRLDDAIDVARDAGVVVYAIGIEGKGFDFAPLRSLASATGGSYHGASSTASLPSLYRSLAEELSRTWRLEYLTAARPGDSVHLSVSAGSAGRTASPLVFPGSAEKPGKSLLPASLTSNALTTVLLALVTAFLVLLSALLALASRDAGWLRSRLEAHLGKHQVARRNPTRGKFLVVRRLVRATDDALAGKAQWQRLRLLLERASLPLRPAEFGYIAAGCGVGLGLLAAVAAAPSLVILLLMAVGGSIPFGFALFRASRRKRRFEDQLPDVLVTIAASLKAGHSFRQGLQSVVDEGQEPASEEFNRVLTETRLGRQMDEALAEMGVRIGSADLEFVISAVTIQRQVGGSLATLFDMVADAVRQRQQFARKIKGLTAMGRMSAYVLIALPFFLAAAMTAMNYEYMAPLYHTSTGHTLIATGLGMMAFGSLVLKKIVSFRG